MSTQQILGVVGGVVGAFFGYPQLGFVVGSLVGGLLTPGEKTEGPRVDDLKVQVSTYGAGIPILYGTERVGGNVVWSTNKIEVETTTGGKGGEPENTSYRYYVHMGIVLCETPRDGSTVSIVQIFQDGKLIYDARSGIPIGSALASAENPHAYFVLYQGHADQLPDPGEEAWMGGPGSVPAYRGVVRIRMNAVECPGGRVPQFSFVLSTSAEATPKYILFDEEISVDFRDSGVGRPVFYASGESDVIRIGAFTANSVAQVNSTWKFGIDGVAYGVEQRRAEDIWPVDLGGPFAVGVFKGFSIRCYRAAPLSSETAITWYATETATTSTGSLSGLFPSDEFLYGAMVSPDGNRLMVFTSTTDPAGQITKWYELTDFLGIARQGSAIPSLAQGRLGYGSSIANADFTGILADDGLSAWVSDAASAQMWVIEEDVFKASGPSVVFTVQEFFSHAITIISNRVYVVGGNRLACIMPRIEYSTEPVAVKDIIADQCDRAGEARFDLSGIPDTDTLHGYKLQNPASARSNIDPQLTAFAIYIVDEDGTIKFKKYEDITSEASIAYDELGQAEDGAEAAGAMPLNRAQEVDLPRSVSVSYIEPAIDYQTASEKEVRQITESNEDMIIELPMATSSNHAKQVASMILFARWRAQNTRSFKTSRKYAFLSPGDGVTVEYPRGSFRLWRITSMTDTGALCEFNVEPGDAELYTQTAIGATGYVGQQVAPMAPPTNLAIVDGPLLTDAGNSAGPYVALDGYTDDWGGGELLIGDDDTNLVSRGSTSVPAPIGMAESTLGAWSRNIVDETNLLTVNVGNDELNSTTRDLMLSSTVNAFAIGANGRWEIAQFQRADALGSGRYLLSGLRRGLRGTEANTGTHQVGDTFILLVAAGLLKPSAETGSIGQTRSYRAVSKGRSQNSAASQTYANTGEALRPFSPVDLRKSLSGSDIVITWHRRTRFSENVLAGIFPLGEASERYLLELCISSSFATVMRSFAVSTESATYTAAMQAFDGYAGGPLYARVRQISDSVGAGHELQSTL
ncbi:phage tail protein [Variovorax paradoxus]|nr:phage tail protein [Variovorax paradoxus]